MRPSISVHDAWRAFSRSGHSHFRPSSPNASRTQTHERLMTILLEHTHVRERMYNGPVYVRARTSLQRLAHVLTPTSSSSSPRVPSGCARLPRFVPSQCYTYMRNTLGTLRLHICCCCCAFPSGGGPGPRATNYGTSHAGRYARIRGKGVQSAHDKRGRKFTHQIPSRHEQISQAN